MYGQGKAIEEAAENSQWDLVIVRSLQLFIQVMSLPQTCFTGETHVAAEDGQIRIDEIEVGDKVWAYNIFTGETALKEVTKVYVHEVDEILHLYTSCGDIDTTTNHPFYVIDKGWVAAGDLNNGDEVYLLDGSTAYIIGSDIEKLDETILVYNLEVEDFNTYFVGDVPVLVHNYISNREANQQKNKVLNNEDVTFKTKQDAIDFLNKKFPNFAEEMAGHRSAEGWHFDAHEIAGLEGIIEHINLYSKKLGFRVHLFWGE